MLCAYRKSSKYQFYKSNLTHPHLELMIYHTVPFTGSIQSCPQPLEQHIFLSGHFLSAEHFSSQVPTLPSGIFGHIPAFSAKISFEIVCLFVCLMVFNATFNNISAISWQSVLLVEETGGPGENHRHVANQTNFIT